MSFKVNGYMDITKIFFATIFNLLVIISCKKEIVDTTSPFEKLTLGTTKTWKYLESKTDGKNDLGECNNDDRLIFNALNNKLKIDRGVNRCYANEMDVETEFELKEKDTILKIDDESYKILKFTKSTLKLISIPGVHADGEIHDHKNEITLVAIN